MHSAAQAQKGGISFRICKGFETVHTEYFIRSLHRNAPEVNIGARDVCSVGMGTAHGQKNDIAPQMLVFQ